MWLIEGLDREIDENWGGNSSGNPNPSVSELASESWNFVLEVWVEIKSEWGRGEVEGERWGVLVSMPPPLSDSARG